MAAWRLGSQRQLTLCLSNGVAWRSGNQWRKRGVVMAAAKISKMKASHRAWRSGINGVA
jgi:hypothetical protein